MEIKIIPGYFTEDNKAVFTGEQKIFKTSVPLVTSAKVNPETGEFEVKKNFIFYTFYPYKRFQE